MPTAFEARVTQTFPAELTVIHCGKCGGIYALNEKYRSDKAKEGGTWNCPYCQVGWGYSGNSENERLNRENTRLLQRIDQEKARGDSVERKLSAAKGQATKLRRRVGAGVCPCCHRTFKQLAAHMTDKHPEFQKEQPHD